MISFHRLNTQNASKGFKSFKSESKSPKLSLNTVRAFVQRNGAKDNIYRALAELEIMGISKKIDNSNNQTTITKFFK